MELDQGKLEAVVTMALNDLSAAQGGVMMSLGHTLGLYKSLHGKGPLSSAEVARGSGCAERYVREWLNSQVAGGYLAYHPQSRTYEMTPEQAMVLAVEDSPVFFPSAWQVNASLWLDEAKILEAFRTGKGIGWGEHDGRLHAGVAAFYRNAYRASLVPEWLPSLDGVVAKLTAGGRVADVACGHGHSTVILAEAFPSSRFWGYDVHEGSILAARRHAEEAGVADRVTFEVRRATEIPGREYDLVCFFDALHDMGHPDRALAHAAACMAEDGTVMLVEPFANDAVEDNVGAIGRLYYAGSATMCCPHAVSEEGEWVLGAQAGAERIGEVVRAAGLTRFRRAMETPFNLILEARK